MNFTVRDGVRLAYVEAGQGGEPVLLVHGMQCDHTHMLPLFEHLARSRRVVAVDLRGHGASDKPAGDYSNAVFHADIAHLCAALGLARPVGIGHSFGGSMLLDLAVQRPDLLGGLVLLDSGVRTLADKQAELGPAYEAPVSREFLASRLFGPDDPPALKAAILERMAATPQHVVDAMRKTVLAFDGAAAAQACRLPALFLLADKPFTDAATLASLGPNWRTGQVVGAGHFVQLVAPDQVNAMVDRFLALLPKS